MGDLWAKVVEGINAGSGKAALALVAGLLGLVTFWIARRDRSSDREESRREKFEDLQQKVIGLMVQNNSALLAAQAECQILANEMERALHAVPEGVDIGQAEIALDQARAMTAQVEHAVVAQRSTLTIAAVERLQKTEESRGKLRYLLRTECMTAAQFDNQPWRYAMDSIRAICKKVQEQ